MDITCNNCSGKFRIPDEKIPHGRVSIVPCPKCKTRISLEPAKKSAGSAVAKEETDRSEDFEFTEKPFSFIEEEGLTALLCEQNPVARQTIEDALNALDIPGDHIQVISVNNQFERDYCRRLFSNDELTIMPTVTGG